MPEGSDASIADAPMNMCPALRSFQDPVRSMLCIVYLVGKTLRVVSLSIHERTSNGKSTKSRAPSVSDAPKDNRATMTRAIREKMGS